MAEVMTRKMLGNRNDIQVSSAGLFALAGMRASEHSIRTMAKEGVDLTMHRGRQLTKKMLDEADLVVVMTKDHKDTIARFTGARFTGQGMDKVFLLTAFDEDRAIRERDIADPIAQPPEAYERCLAQMKSPITNLVLKLIQGEI